MNKQELKALEAAAIAGLTGAAKKAAQKAFYDRHKAAIRAAADAEANAATAARNAPAKAIIEAAAAKGLTATITANVGIVRGSSRDSVILVSGNTFQIKDTLKASGAVWHAPAKAWAFASEEAFNAAMAAI